MEKSTPLLSSPPLSEVYATSKEYMHGLLHPTGAYEILPTGRAPPRRTSSYRYTIILFVLSFLVGGVLFGGDKRLAAALTLAPLSAPAPSTNRIRAPTIRIVDVPSNAGLLAASKDCHWGWWKWWEGRLTVQSAFGGAVTATHDLPYVLRKTDQFALDDILRAKMMTYDHIQLSNWTIDWKAHDEPDFVFLPFLSAMHGENYDCGDAPVFAATIANATAEIVKLAEEVNKGYDYPRLIIALGVIRLSQGVRLLTEELMKTLSDKIILLGIETDPLTITEGLQYTIDIPYPTRFHLAQDPTADWRDTRDTDYFLNHERRTLVHYAGSSTHPWNVHVDDGIKGFAVRAVLATTLQTHIDEELAASNRGEVRSTTKVIFDDFARMDGTYDFANRAYDHMLNSVFTLEPAGDTPTRRGFYDAIALGTIPVVFRNSTYARLLPSSPEMDTSLYTIVLDERELIDGVGLDVIQRLELIPQSVIRQKQLAIQAIQRKMQYSFPSVDTVLPVTQQTRSSMLAPSMMEVGEDAFSMILRELDTIKNGEWKHRS